MTTRDDYIGSTAQNRRISEALEAYNLKFVESHLLPTLPDKILFNIKSIMWYTVASLKMDLLSLKIPRGMLDYDEVSLDTCLINPPIHLEPLALDLPATNTEKNSRSINCYMDKFTDLCEGLLAFQAYCSYGTQQKT